jgi:hypothetical protein
MFGKKRINGIIGGLLQSGQQKLDLDLLHKETTENDKKNPSAIIQKVLFRFLRP